MNFITAFAAAMLGHFVGDYLFQNDWMATNKWKPGWLGHKACTVHVFFYTCCLYLFVGWHPLFLFINAATHWVIDRWSLAKYWLFWKNGKRMEDIWDLKPYDELENEKLSTNVWKIAFAAPVYIFNDNTIHWVILWFTCKHFFGA